MQRNATVLRLKSFWQQILAALILVTVCDPVYAQEGLFYYYKGQKTPVSASKTEVFIRFKDAQSKEVAKSGLTERASQLSELKFDHLGRESAYTLRLGADMETALRALRSRADVEYAYPVLIDNEKQVGYVTNDIILNVRLGQESALRTWLSSRGAILKERIAVGNEEDWIVSIPGASDVFSVANALHESGLVGFAHPSFTSPAELHQVPNDELFGQQWWLNNTGQTGGFRGADVSALKAWALTTGREDVVVAVFDEGFDIDHPEMAGKIVNPYDAAFDNDSPRPKDPSDNHGTPCMGIIGALTNNSVGVASLGYNVKVMPVNCDGLNPGAAGPVLLTDITFARAAARVIAQPGVVAVSNSWGGGFRTQARDQAFINIRNQCRNGLGSVILFSSGNSAPNAVSYPASAEYSIAVGSVNASDFRAGTSQFGNDLNLVAPGVSVLTLDRTGAPGYTASDYTFFGGTSAACPVAAGVVALMGSANPALTGRQMETLLQQTTDKSGGYFYDARADKPHGLWNNEVGYGRVNARRAVEAALGQSKFVSFITPSAGVNLQQGRANLIRWQAIGFTASETISLELLENGTVVESIAAGVLASSGSVSYTPSATLSGGENYSIRARFGSASDESVPLALVSSSPVFTFAPIRSSPLATTYTDLGSSGVAIALSNTDDANSEAQPIGFPFSFNGKTVTNFILNTNGFVKLGATEPSSAALFPAGIRNITEGSALASTDSRDSDILSPFNVDLIGTDSADYRVETSGTEGSRVTTIQFKNVREKRDTTSGFGALQISNFSFQIRLFEADGRVEFVYNTKTPTANTAQFRTAIVGIKGNPGQVLSMQKNSTDGWVFTAAAAQFLNGLGVFNYSNGFRPNAGQTYRFAQLSEPSRLALPTGAFPTTVFSGAAFEVTVQTRDDANALQSVSAATEFTLSLASGTGTLEGNLTGVIPAGQNTGRLRGVRYNGTGAFSVTVSSSGLSSVTSGNITANPTPATLSENFQAASLPATWRVINPDQNTVTWSRQTPTSNPNVGGTAGSAALTFNSYPQVGHRDTLASPVFTVDANQQLLFDYAYYKGREEDGNDSIEVRLSTDGGNTYPHLLFRNGGDDFRTMRAPIGTIASGANFSTNPFNRGQWKPVGLSLSNYQGQVVSVAFVSINGAGGRVFVDSIRIAPLSAATSLRIEGVFGTAGAYFAGQPFTVAVRVVDPSGAPAFVTEPTTVTLIQADGNGQLNGTLSVTIPAGEGTAVFNDLVYSDNDALRLSAAVTAGMTLEGTLVTTLPSQGNSALLPYTRGVSRTAYQPISTPALPVTNGTADDGYLAPVALPFAFTYAGANYTSVSINTNGFMIMGSAVPLPAANTFANGFKLSGGVSRTIAPWWDDLRLDSAAGQPLASIRVETSGQAPNRVFTVQFANISDLTNNLSLNPATEALRLNFQVKLYETSNIIEFVYGNKTGIFFSPGSSASSGITGNSGGVGDFIHTFTGSRTVSPDTLSSRFSFPDEGTVYRFYPAPPNPVSVSATETMLVGNGQLTRFGATNLAVRADVSRQGEVTANFFNAAPPFGNAPSEMVTVSQYYWQFQNGGARFTNGQIRIAVNDLIGVATPASLRWLKRDLPGQDWVSLGGEIQTDNGVDVLVSTVPFETFSEFAVASTTPENSLPVELQSFTATVQPRGVEVKWVTLAEKNNSGFEVQRRIGGAAEWSVLEFVRGNGTTNETHTYSFIDRTASGSVAYRLKQLDFDGKYEYSPVIEVEAGLPRRFQLAQNYPNPFNPGTRIMYQLPVSAEVTLKVYDILGREVTTLVNSKQDAGRYEVLFNASGLSSGLYFYRLQAGRFVQTMRMTLLK